jgi:hypothetical protein
MLRAFAFWRAADRSSSCRRPAVWAASARAQGITSELSGTVTDVLGGLVPGADVALTHEASHATRRTVTNRSGFFAFAASPPGRTR